MKRAIIVGVDGSDSDDLAVRWAALEALRTGHELVIVHAYETVNSGYAPGLVMPADVVDAIVAEAHEIVDAAGVIARDVDRGLCIRTKVVMGRAASVLWEWSVQARVLMVVVGSRGRGALAAAVLGSVSIELAVHARCPVVVVRGDGNRGGPVVVGVDGSPASAAATAAAFTRAAAWGVGLTAVHAYSDLRAGVLHGFGLRDAQHQQMAAQFADGAHRFLATQLASLERVHPDVRVETVIAPDGPATRILAAAQDARIVVLGNRGRGGFVDILLGSTSHSVLAHATCPVMIIKDPVHGPGTRP